MEDRVIEIYFFDSTRVIRRPLSVLAKASDYFKNYFSSPFQDSSSNEFHLKDFSYEEFMDILPFMDDPYQSVPDCEIARYFMLNASVLKNKNNHDGNIIHKESYFPRSENSQPEVNIYRHRSLGVCPFTSFNTQIDTFMNEDGYFPVNFKDAFLAFHFQFVWPVESKATIESIELLWNSEKNNGLDVYFRFQKYELSVFEKKGYYIVTFPIYQFHGSALEKTENTDFFFKVHAHGSSQQMRMMYIDVKLENEAIQKFLYPHDVFHMIPCKMASLDLSKSSSVTFPFNENFQFNMMYFRFDDSIKGLIPHFHDARLVATIEMGDQYMKKRLFEIFSSDQNVNIIQRNQYGGETMYSKMKRFPFQICELLKQCIDKHHFYEMDQKDNETFLKWFQEETDNILMQELMRLLLEKLVGSKLCWISWTQNFAEFNEAFEKLKNESPAISPLDEYIYNKKMILFDESLWSISMRNYQLKKPLQNELFENHNDMMGIWQLDVTTDIVEWFRGSKVEDVKNITFEVQGNTSSIPIPVHVIVNRLILERIRHPLRGFCNPFYPSKKTKMTFF